MKRSEALKKLHELYCDMEDDDVISPHSLAECTLQLINELGMFPPPKDINNYNYPLYTRFEDRPGIQARLEYPWARVNVETGEVENLWEPENE